MKQLCILLLISLLFLGCGSDSTSALSYKSVQSVELSDANIQKLRLTSLDANNVSGITTFSTTHTFKYIFKIENIENEVSGTWSYNQESNLLTYTVPLLGNSTTTFNGSSIFLEDQLVILSEDSASTLASGKIIKLELLQ